MSLCALFQAFTKNGPKKRGQSWITPALHVYYLCMEVFRPSDTGHSSSSPTPLKKKRELQVELLPPPTVSHAECATLHADLIAKDQYFGLLFFKNTNKAKFPIQPSKIFLRFNSFKV
jgi:hypothetical protein